MRLRLSVVATAVAVLLLAGGQARAEITYSYVTDMSNYNAAPGSTVTVSVYLQENTNGGASFLANQNGLYSAGVSAYYASNNGVGTVAQVLDVTAGGTVTYNTAAPGANGGFGSSALTNANNFPTNEGSNYPGQSAYSGGTTGNDAELAIALAAGANAGPYAGSTGGKVLIGTFQVVAGSAGDVTTYNLSGLNGNPTGYQSGSDATFALPTSATPDLDKDGSSGAFSWTGANDPSAITSFTVTATAGTPEPSSMLLCGLGSLGLGYVGYRRRKTAMVNIVVA